MNYEFKKTNNSKSKFLLLIGLAIFWTIFLAIFIYTSWYENDVSITKAFGDAGFYNLILNRLSDYFVKEGNFTLTTLTIPLGILLVESLLTYLKKYYAKNHFFQSFYRTRHFYEFGVVGLWTIGTFIGTNILFWTDQGFGVGIDVTRFTTLTYSIIASILIILFNNSICLALSWIVIYKIAAQPDFVEQGYWKKIILYTLFTILMYFVILTFKQGFQRPLYYQTVWSEKLDYLKTINPKAWQHYMSQNQFNYGWHYGPTYDEFMQINDGYINNSWQSIPGQWPWWRIAQVGSFWNGSNGIEGTFNPDNAFPSGHLATGMSVFGALWILTSGTIKTNKQRWIQLIARTIGIGYIICMFSALGFAYAHWMSDMAFTIILAPFIFFLSQKLTHLIINNWLIKLDKSISQKGQAKVIPTKVK